MDTERWGQFQRFFKLKGKEGEDPEKPIKIAGLLRSVYPHQLYACWWMMLTGRSLVGGGYIADYMGMGKVCTF
jgi:hypothetical protein